MSLVKVNVAKFSSAKLEAIWSTTFMYRYWKKSSKTKKRRRRFHSWSLERVITYCISSFVSYQMPSTSSSSVVVSKMKLQNWNPYFCSTVTDPFMSRTSRENKMSVLIEFHYDIDWASFSELMKFHPNSITCMKWFI